MAPACVATLREALAAVDVGTPLAEFLEHLRVHCLPTPLCGA